MVNSKKNSLLNYLLIAIIFFGAIVIGLVFYLSVGGSKQNVSNIFLPYYGELFGYGSSSPNSVIKLIGISETKQSFNVKKDDTLEVTKDGSSGLVLISLYQDGNALPFQSQTWNLITSSKSLDLQGGEYLYWNDDQLYKVEFKDNLPVNIKSTKYNTALNSSNDIIPKDAKLTQIKYWPETKQIWTLYNISQDKSLAIGWDTLTGKQFTPFKLPKSKSFYFSADNNTLIFADSNNTILYFYTSEGLEKFIKTVDGKFNNIFHINNKNYVLTEKTEKVSANLTRLTSVDKLVQKVEVWDQDFNVSEKKFNTDHTKLITVFESIPKTSLILTAGKDGLVTVIDSKDYTTIEEHPVDPKRDNKNIVGGYLDTLSKQLIIVFEDGDTDFYQIFKI